RSGRDCGSLWKRRCFFIFRSSMRCVFYVEEDCVAGLLREYFAVSGGDAYCIKRGTNGNLADRLSKNAVDLFLAQSEDPERLARILEVVRQQGRKIPTFVLTSHSNETPQE